MHAIEKEKEELIYNLTQKSIKQISNINIKNNTDIEIDDQTDVNKATYLIDPNFYKKINSKIEEGFCSSFRLAEQTFGNSTSILKKDYKSPFCINNKQLENYTKEKVQQKQKEESTKDYDKFIDSLNTKLINDEKGINNSINISNSKTLLEKLDNISKKNEQNKNSQISERRNLSYNNSNLQTQIPNTVKNMHKQSSITLDLYSNKNIILLQLSVFHIIN